MSIEQQDPFKLANPPIREAIVDINCSMPSGFDLEALKSKAEESLAGVSYPKMRTRVLHGHTFSPSVDGNLQVGPERSHLEALQFLRDDERQLVQFRKGGFSFNRLAPYEGMSAYLPDLERTWGLFCDIAQPELVVNVALRMVNRIVLPSNGATCINIDEYLINGPRLPSGVDLIFNGFLNQHSAEEAGTGNIVQTTISTQPVEDGGLPLIFDVSVRSQSPIQSLQWFDIEPVILTLRELKNKVFKNTLTEKCLSLFN